MKFIDKLIEETQNKELDFVWQFTQGNKFKYKADKHPLTDLTFSLDEIVLKEITKDSGKVKVVPDNTKGLIVFPNGAGMEVDRSKLELLNKECINAIFRAMDVLANDYSNGTMQAEMKAQAEKEEKDKLNKEKEKEVEKPTDKNKTQSKESPK
jgi:hypothetical protein